jgi:hypothetical protein
MMVRRTKKGLLTPVTLVAMILVAGCASQQSVDVTPPEQGDPNYFKARDSMADEVYVTDNLGKRDWFNGIRRVYIAPLNASSMQIIQPPGAEGEERWEVNDIEQAVIEKTFVREMARAMEADQAYHIVAEREEAQAVLYARLIAVHPYRTRTGAEADGGRGGGAVTMSFALVDPSDKEVVIRAVDTKSTDDIWAFDNIHDDRDAIDLIFESWGYQVRRSLLFLQARLDAVPKPIILKRQE